MCCGGEERTIIQVKPYFAIIIIIKYDILELVGKIMKL